MFSDIPAEFTRSFIFAASTYRSADWFPLLTLSHSTHSRYALAASFHNFASLKLVAACL